jgi:hypothetical protein
LLNAGDGTISLFQACFVEHGKSFRRSPEVPSRGAPAEALRWWNEHAEGRLVVRDRVQMPPWSIEASDV